MAYRTTAAPYYPPRSIREQFTVAGRQVTVTVRGIRASDGEPLLATDWADTADLRLTAADIEAFQQQHALAVRRCYHRLAEWQAAPGST